MMTVLVLFVLIVLMLSLGLALTAFMTKRAVSKVIEIFRQHNALHMGDAKTLDELELRRPDFIQRMMRPGIISSMPSKS